MKFTRVVFALAMVVALFASMSVNNSADAQNVTNFRVEYTNAGNTDFSNTPVWFGLHNGGFDFFDAGSTATPEVELIAELGQFGALSTQFRDDPASPGNIEGAIFGTTGVPPITPGETSSDGFTPINAANYQYFSFASMLVPTNDLFFGNDNATAYQIFDGAGLFLGDTGNTLGSVFTIDILGSGIYDAGTEDNDASATGGAAFAQGRNAMQGGDQGGVITGATQADLDVYNGLTDGAGRAINDTTLAAGEVFGTIRIIAIPEPNSIAVLSLVGLCGLARRRRR